MKTTTPHIPPLIPRDELRVLCRSRRWQPLLHTALTWLSIALAIAVCLTHWHPLTYLVAIIFVAGRQHALLVLMHEAAHYRLHPNRAINDGIARFCIAWPHFISLEAYRRDHNAHHRYLMTDHDPDLQAHRATTEYGMPLTKRRLLYFFLRDVSGFGLFGQLKAVLRFRGSGDATETPTPIRGFAYYGALAVVIVGTGGGPGFVLFWLVPLITWLKWFLYVRALGEHYGLTCSPAQPMSLSRTVLPRWWQRWFFCPFNVSFHAEHHLFPGVPYHNLPALRERLVSSPAFASRSPSAHGYTQVFREVCDGEKR